MLPTESGAADYAPLMADQALASADQAFKKIVRPKDASSRDS